MQLRIIGLPEPVTNALQAASDFHNPSEPNGMALQKFNLALNDLVSFLEEYGVDCSRYRRLNHNGKSYRQ